MDEKGRKVVNLSDVITVVTPTFNRAHTLINCYNSLINQTSSYFVWMIVDDGSTDGTESIVNKWIDSGHINIEYYWKENGGKASALNIALDKISTKYWVCLDSDDTFANNAIELAYKELDLIKNESKYCGFLALRNYPNGEVFGNKRIPNSVKEASVIEITDKYKIRSEFIQFYKTDITSKYRFPEIEGEKFIPPEYLANELNKKYTFLVSQKVFCYCEYLSDGLSRNKIDIIKKNPKGYTLIALQAFELSDSFIMKSKRCLKYISGCILSKEKGCLKNSPHKAMTFLYYPLGWLVFRIRFK